MTIYEFGKENKKHIVLIHPSMVMYDYFLYVWPLLEQEYHVIVPALPGYDKTNKGNFTSVESIAKELGKWLVDHHCQNLSCVYGCSMGGAIVTRMLVDSNLEIEKAIIDGGITPYQLPWLVTRLIAIKDFLLISLGKFGGMKILEKAFSTNSLSKEDLEYAADVFQFVSYTTIWRTFDSCNNYSMPTNIHTTCPQIEYWYGDREEKERKWDIQYFKKNFPNTKFIKLKDVGHGGMAAYHPEEFVERIRAI